MAKTFDLNKISSGRTAAEVKNKVMAEKPSPKYSKILETDSQFSENNKEDNGLVEQKLAERALDQQPATRTESPQGSVQSATLPVTPENSESAILERPNLEGKQTVVRPQLDRSQTVVTGDSKDRSQTVVRPQLDRSQTVVTGDSKDRSQTVVRPQLERSQTVAETVVRPQLAFEFFPLMGQRRKDLFCHVAKSCVESGSLMSSEFMSSELVRVASIGGKKPFEGLRDAVNKMQELGYFDRVVRRSVGHDGVNKFWLNKSVYQAFLNEIYDPDRSQTVVQTVVERSSSILNNINTNTTTTEGYTAHWADTFNVTKFQDPLFENLVFGLDASLRKKIKERAEDELTFLTKIVAFAMDRRKNKSLGIRILMGLLRDGQPYNSDNTPLAEKKAKVLLGLTAPVVQNTAQHEQSETVSQEDNWLAEFIRTQREWWNEIKNKIKAENPTIADFMAQAQAYDVVRELIRTGQFQGSN